MSDRRCDIFQRVRAVEHKSRSIGGKLARVPSFLSGIVGTARLLSAGGVLAFRSMVGVRRVPPGNHPVDESAASDRSAEWLLSCEYPVFRNFVDPNIELGGEEDIPV